MPKRTRSHHLIQSYPASWTITAQFTPSLTHTPRHPPLAPLRWRLGAGAFTLHMNAPHSDTSLHVCVCRQTGARTLTQTFYTDTCMHAGARTHTQRKAVRICSDPERQHGTQHARDAQCHDNSEPPETAPPPSPSPGVPLRNDCMEAGDSLARLPLRVTVNRHHQPNQDSSSTVDRPACWLPLMLTLVCICGYNFKLEPYVAIFISL